MIVEGSQFLSLKSVKLLLTKVIGKKLIPPKAKARLNHEQNPAPPPSLPSKQLYKEQNISPDKNPTFLQINLLYILSVQDFLYSHLYHWPQTTCNQETLCPFLVKRRMSPSPSLTMSNPTGTFMKLKESWGGGYKKHFQPTTWRRKEQSRASSWKSSAHLSSFHSFSFAKVFPTGAFSSPNLTDLTPMLSHQSQRDHYRNPE